MMYAGDEERVGIPFHPDFVSIANDRWCFISPLLQRYREWKYYRRVLPRVLCVNPATGSQDMRLSALLDQDADLSVRRSVQAIWAESAYSCFWEDSTDLDRALWDAVACVNPPNYQEMVELYADEINEAACRKYLEYAEKCQSDGSWTFHYLERFDEISRTVGKWEQELDRLRRGEILDLWKFESSADGASKGGRRSAESRAKNVLITAEKARQLREQLLSQGRAERSIASIIAKRHDVSPDHIRRLIRRQKPT